MICTVFPYLSAKKFEQVNLAKEANDILFLGHSTLNPYAEVETQEMLVMHVRTEMQCDYTFGGYGEDRSKLWRGLEATSNIMIHLGVDLNNLVVEMPVICPCDGKIVHVLRDYSKSNGWGGRIVIEMEQPFKSCAYLLIGHLDPQSLLQQGERIKKNSIAGFVGKPEQNGGWFVHVHFQLVNQSMIDHFGGDWTKIDGYLLDKDIADGFKISDWSADPTDLLFKQIF